MVQAGKSGIRRCRQRIRSPGREAGRCAIGRDHRGHRLSGGVEDGVGATPRHGKEVLPPLGTRPHKDHEVAPNDRSLGKVGQHSVVLCRQAPLGR